MEKINYFVFHKLIPCILITIYAFMCLYGSFVYATDIYYNDTIYNVNFSNDINEKMQNYPYWVIVQQSNGRCYFGLISNNTAYTYTNTSNPYLAITLKRYTSSSSFDELISILSTVTLTSFSVSGINTSDILASSCDILDSEGNVVFQASKTIKDPEITTSIEDLETLNFDTLSCQLNSYWEDDNIVLQCYDWTNSTNDNIKELYPKNIIELNTQSEYYVSQISEQNAIFFIPIGELGIKYQVGGSYAFRFAKKTWNEEFQTDFYERLGDDFIRFTITEDASAEKLEEINKKFEEYKKEQERQEQLQTQKETTEAVKEQTEAIKEQHETSKGILGKIGDILSYINPFSENFFAYKLVQLIVDGLKSLFIPEEGFFDNFFTELKDWFSARFGLLFYPFELIINILNRMLNINLGEPSFHIPEIKEPITNQTLIAEQNFNFNSILENSSFAAMHNVYFIIVDAIIIIALVNLIKHKLEEVETK